MPKFLCASSGSSVDMKRCKYPLYLYASAVVIGLISFLHGFCLGSLNSLMVVNEDYSYRECYAGVPDACPQGSLLRSIQLNTVMQELGTGAGVLGAWAGSMIAGTLLTKFGRRGAIILADILVIGGSCLCALATTPLDLFSGRFVQMIGVGIGSVSAPTLLSEISEDHNRGKITAINQLMLVIGALVTGVVGWGFATRVWGGWRGAQALAALPAALQLLLAAPRPAAAAAAAAAARGGEEEEEEYGGAPPPPPLERRGRGGGGRRWGGRGLLPESPAWLVAARPPRVEEAAEVLALLRGQDVGSILVSSEFMALQAEASKSATAPTWNEVFCAGKPFAIGLAVICYQAACGINAVVFYSTELFLEAGVKNSLVATISVGIVNLLGTVTVMAIIDSYGRKKLLCLGASIMCLSLSLQSVILLLVSSSFPAQGPICVILTLSYVIGFALSFGGVGCVLVTEIIPYQIRSKAMSLFLSCNWALNLIISLSTLSLIELLGSAASVDNYTPKETEKQRGVGLLFGIFAAVCLTSLYMIKMHVYEPYQTSLPFPSSGSLKEPLLSHVITEASVSS